MKALERGRRYSSKSSSKVGDWDNTVFLQGDPNQNVNSFMTPVSDSVFHALSHGSLGFDLYGSPINHHCKDFHWVLMNFDQSENKATMEIKTKATM